MHPHAASRVIRDGAVGVSFIRMPWEDNRGGEVVVGRMILHDVANLKLRKSKIARWRLTKRAIVPTCGTRFFKHKKCIEPYSLGLNTKWKDAIVGDAKQGNDRGRPLL